MPKRIEYKKGDKVGAFTYIMDAQSKGDRRMAVLQCHCGAELITSIKDVKNGKIVNCKECSSKARTNNATVHGNAYHPLYGIYICIKQRCYNVNYKGYPYYGGRGIKMCQAWLDSFDAFVNDMGNRPSKRHTIERDDVNGDYSPDNCRWATMKEQGNNRRNTVLYKFNGYSHTLSDWAKFTSIPHSVLRERINKNNWPLERAFTEPYNMRSNNKIEINNSLIPYAFGFINA